MLFLAVRETGFGLSNCSCRAGGQAGAGRPWEGPGVPPATIAKATQTRRRPWDELQCPVQPETMLFDTPHHAPSLLHRGVTHCNVFSFVFWGAPSKSESPLMCEARAPQQGGAGGSSGSGLGSSITACKKVTWPNSTLVSAAERER